MEINMLKAGLLGVGTIGCTHLGAYNSFMKTNGAVSLEACFDIFDTNFKYAENDVREYTNLDEFFENEKGKLDFVDICLPTFMHKEVAVRAMNCGFNVLCEKPMALSYEDACEMNRVAEKTGTKLMVAHCLRFADDYAVLKDYITNKTLGEVKSVNYFVYESGLPGGRNNWFKDDKKSGGAILDTNVHNIDLFLYLLGNPKSLSAVSSAGGYDSFSATMLFDNGVHVNLQCDFAVPDNKHNIGRCFRINFENGYILRNLDEESTYVAVDKNGIKTDLNPFIRDVRHYYSNEIGYFADCIERNIQPVKCHPGESAMAIKIIEALKKSADMNGERIVF